MGQTSKQSTRGSATIASTGDRASVRLFNNKRNQRLLVTIRATVDITTSTTVLRNNGDASSLVSLYLNENGADRWTVDGRVAKALGDAISLTALAGTRASAANTAPTTLQLVSRILLPFSIDNPTYNVVGSETTYGEGDVRAPIAVEASAKSNAFGQLFGDGAGSISSLTMEVEQIYVEEAGASVPFYIPTARQLVQSISAASANEPVFIKTSNRIRAIVLTQEDDTGVQTSLISAVALRGDNGDIIGPGQSPIDNLAATLQSDLGPGAPSDGSHLIFWQQKGGRLSKALSPALQYQNLRFELAVDPAGFTNPRVRVTLYELERPAPQPGGRQLVTDAIPAAILRA